MTAVALMVSMIAGASILGFPYVFAQTGFLTGVVTLILVGIATTFMTLYVAEMDLNDDKVHHISGFAKKYFGKRGKYFTLLVETFGIYTAIIAYITAIGLALSNMFGLEPLLMGSVFFVFAAFLIFFGFKRFCKLDFSIAIIKIFILLFFIGVFFANVETANVADFQLSKIFAPFGIVLFACLGYNVIPEMKKTLKNKKQLMPAIIAAMIVVFTIYILFSYVFLGTFGTTIGEVAIVGLPNYTLLGNIFVILAMTIPFIALADAIKHIYVEDIGIDKRTSWFLSAFIPFMIYVYANLGFVKLLQLSGTYAGGMLGLLVMFLVLKSREKTKGKRKKCKFRVPGGNFPIYFSIAIFSIGIIYQTFLILGLF